MVLPYPLNAADGGVQRSTLQMGEYFSSLGWNVAYVSLSKQGHSVRDEIRLYCPDTELVEASDARILGFLNSAVADFVPDVIFNQIGLTEQPAKAIHDLRCQGFSFKIIACFRNSPGFYRSNLEHSSYLSRRLGPNFDAIPGIRLIDHVVTRVHRKRTARRFRAALQHCDRLMLLAPSYTRDLEWYIPDLDHSRILTVPNAYAIPESMSWEKKQNRLLYVGRMEQAQKNVMLLPEIWSHIQDDAPDWEFHLVGDGPDMARLKRRFDELDCRDVTFHGRQRADDFFRQARIFIMTSTYEGFANTLIESQMHGVVPVAFKSFSGIDWMVNDKEDACLIPPYEIPMMREAILALMRNESRLKELALAGRRNAARFSEDQVGRQWQAILADLLDHQQEFQVRQTDSGSCPTN